MQKVYYVWLNQIQLQTRVKLELLQYLKTPEAIYLCQNYSALGLKPKAIERLKQCKYLLSEAEKEVMLCKQKGIEIITLEDEAYPESLKCIPDRPIMFYLKGNADILKTPMVAIVGARECLEYGYQMSIKFARELAAAGITVVSGMAKGIDAAAHEGALETGRTLAVLGTGIDICYPACNRNLYNKIPEEGAIISEYPLQTPPRPYQFPQRNRVISGLVSGVLVTEADCRSGSLITANLALEYNRDVFAVPGDLRSRMSLGTNELIKKGAKCITCTKDILEELPVKIQKNLQVSLKNTLKNHDNELAQEERMVYAYVSWNPIFLNELLTSTKLSYKAIYRDLTQLELKGYIKKLPGERYVRS